VVTNEVGVDEFVAWCRAAGCEPMMSVNLGTRETQAALELLEYCNHPAGTDWSDLRAQHGSPQPYGIRLWCLGNEMDGPWQLGHRSASEYAALAARTAAAMKMYDPSLELVVCGSSSSRMPTFGEWEREVLTRSYEHVDYISCHAYYEELDGDRASFLASSVDMDRFIDAVVATADHVAHTRHSARRVDISFDEWNVWYMSRDLAAGTKEHGWPVAPRLLENVYSAVDAVVVGSLLITLLRRSDRVRAACQAQLVNVIAPIMTEPGGPAWRQSIFHPFSITSRLARGTVIAPRVDAPAMYTARFGAVPIVDAVATIDADRGAVFLVHRGLTEEASVEITLPPGTPGQLAACLTLHERDLDAANTMAEPDRVAPRPNASAMMRTPGTLAVTVPPASWTAVELRADQPS
jgi:alpha-N-arabinofuranosidase